MQGNFSDKLIFPAAADKLIAAHDGDLALLYLFIQRTGSRDLERAAGELFRTLREMQIAWEKYVSKYGEDEDALLQRDYNARVVKKINDMIDEGEWE